MKKKELKEKVILLELENDKLKRKLDEYNMLVDALNYKVAYLTEQLKTKTNNEKGEIKRSI